MIPQYIDIHTHHPSSVAITLHAAGIHPWEADSREIESLLPLSDDVQAIGEIGLDYAHPTDRTRQMALFRQQLRLAEARELPVVLHCVRAFEPVMEELTHYLLLAVIFHGFIGSPEQAARAAARGYYLSFGARTFASPRTIEALQRVPTANLFLETDDSDIPIERMYEQAAAVRGTTVGDLQRITTENYEKILRHNDR